MGAPSRGGQGSGNETSGSGANSQLERRRQTGGGGAPHPPAMTFADENGVDAEDVYTKADGIKVPYCNTDPIYWFRRLEIQMQI